MLYLELCPSYSTFKNKSMCQAWWRTTEIPAQEAEAGGLQVQSPSLTTRQSTKQLNEILFLNKIQNRAGDVALWSSALSSILDTGGKKKE